MSLKEAVRRAKTEAELMALQQKAWAKWAHNEKFERAMIIINARRKEIRIANVRRKLVNE